MESYASFNSLIISTLKPLFQLDEKGNYPIAHLDYSGPASKYVIFSTQTIPEVFGSGTNREVKGYVYVDLYSKADESGKSGLIGKMTKALNAHPQLVVTNVSAADLDEEGWYHTELSVTATAQVHDDG